jgi:hypothetical protein
MNFFAWLNIIDELFLLEPKYAEFKTDWGSISAKLRALNDTRVRLAHHTTWDGSQDQGQLRLKPSKFDTRPKSKKYAALSATEILAFIEAVWAVHKQLMQLAKDMTAAQQKNPGEPGAT